jgi:hypothetical protein
MIVRARIERPLYCTSRFCINCDRDATICQLRLALVPNQGHSAKKLLEQVEAAITTTLASLDEASAAPRKWNGKKLQAGDRASMAGEQVLAQ